MRMGDKLIRSIALLALTLGFPAVAFGDAFAGDHCPHHDSFPTQQSAPSGAGHGSHAGHTAHAFEADVGNPDPHGHEHSGPCSCIGQCVTQVGAALPSATLDSVAVATPAMSLQVTRAGAQWAAVDPPYLHPYANAPPSLR